MPRSTAVLSPSLGLYYNRPPLTIPARGLQDGNNFRIDGGRLNNLNLGWERFSDNWKINEPILAIINFFPRNQGDKLVLLSTTDMYNYNGVTGSDDSVSYITPRYEVGTASVSGTTITGAGTSWAALIEHGDQISFGSHGIVTPNPVAAENGGGNDSFTTSLMQFDGVDASTSMSDNGAARTGHSTWTANGNAQLDTAQIKFNSASLLLDGTGDWVSTSDSADFEFGAGEFTVDFWFRMAGGDGVAQVLAAKCDNGGTAAGSEWLITRNAANKIQFAVTDGAAFTTLTGTTTFTTAVNTGWHHVEACRDNTNNLLELYVDGVAEAQAAIAFSIPDTADAVTIGATPNGTSPMNGWIDEYRVSKGTCRHRLANFTPRTQGYMTVWYTIDIVNSDTSLTSVLSIPGIALNTYYTIRRIFHASKANNWDWDVFVRDTVSGNDQLCVTNGVDYVHSWDGIATAASEQSSMAFKCKRLLAYKNMMLYGNLTNQGGVWKPIDLINSDIGKPFAAGATSTGLSSQFTVHDGQDEILALRKLGDNAVIYSERHCVPSQFVGDPTIFIFREAAIDVGPVSPYVVADFGDYHEFLALDAMYSFDGVSLKQVNNHVGREMVKQLDASRKRNAFLHFNEERAEVYWSVPRVADVGVGDPDLQSDKAWTEHYVEPVPPNVETPFSQRDFPFSCAGYYRSNQTLTWANIGLRWDEATFPWVSASGGANFPLILAGDDNGFLWKVNTVQFPTDGTTLVSFVRTGRKPSQADGRGRGLCKRIYAYMTAGSTQLSVELFMAEAPDGAAQSGGSFIMSGDMPPEHHFVSPFRRARYFEYQFGEQNGLPWQLSGFDDDIAPGGFR